VGKLRAWSVKVFRDADSALLFADLA